MAMALNAERLVARPRATRLPMTSDDVRGKTVHGRDGDKLGTVDKLIRDERTGKVASVILSTGGFLGLGQSYHPVPRPALRYAETQGGYVAELDKHMLGGAPGYRPDYAPDCD